MWRKEADPASVQNGDGVRWEMWQEGMNKGIMDMGCARERSLHFLVAAAAMYGGSDDCETGEKAGKRVTVGIPWQVVRVGDATGKRGG